MRVSQRGTDVEPVPARGYKNAGWETRGARQIMKPESQTLDTSTLLEFMFRLGQAYLACGEQTAQVELALRRAASAYGVRRSRVVAFPTAVFISVHEGDDERVTLAEGPIQTLRLDQIADVYAIGNAAQRGEIAPRDGIDQLHAILRKTARFGPLGMIVGHTILTVGLTIVLMPALANLGTAMVLGAVVGVVKVLNRNRPVLAVPLPVLAAALVSLLVYYGASRGLMVDPLVVLVPPLVTFLPGGMLTLGMVELAYGDMVSGSSRLITGFVQLVLITFGLAVGAALVGVRPDQLLGSGAHAYTLPWLPWVGVAIFGVGVYLHFSAPRNSLVWMLAVLLITFAAQRLAGEIFRSEISGFFGMLVATPLGYLIHLRYKGPPPMVTFLPSFWLVVPGSLGLLSVTQMLSDRQAGLDGLVTVIFVLASVALGTLVGAALYKWLTERFGAWQLQSGRVGRYFRKE